MKELQEQYENLMKDYEAKEDAINKPELFWDTYRKDSLDSRSQKTYLVLDSISIKKRIESRIRFGRKIIDGYLPIGKFDLNLRKLFSYKCWQKCYARRVVRILY